MPIYEYECTVCGKIELIHKMGGAPTSCPHSRSDCPISGGSGAINRLLSKTNYQLKGGGFYETDYVKSASTKGDEKSKSNSSTGATSSDSGSKGGDQKGGESKSTESKKESTSCSTGCGCH
jgi:putative FmdB family regulatory protein